MNEHRIREIDFRPFVMKEIDMRDSLCLRVLRPCVYMCLRRVFVCVFSGDRCLRKEICVKLCIELLSEQTLMMGRGATTM